MLCSCAHSTFLIRLNDMQAIARAVYAQADLILLDDVFSALDGETEAHGKKTRYTVMRGLPWPKYLHRCSAKTACSRERSALAAI
jgi:ABC-type phosphate transport system ATPase subunit